MSPREPRLGSVQAVMVSFEGGADTARNAAAALAECDGLVIVDNGSGAATLAPLRALAAAAPERVRLIENAGNVGLDRAQNQGIATARAEGADWLLLLDDDSTPESGLLAAFADALLRLADARRVALLAPQLVQQAGAIATRYWFARGAWGAARRWLANGNDPTPRENLLFAIASGSLVRSTALDDVGPLREDFFIDYIDVELGLRLNGAGWRLALVPAARLRHRLGDPSRHEILGLALKTTHHDAARRFTIFRNRARLWRAYGAARPGWVLLDAAAAIADLLRILAFEEAKAKKLKAALAGIWRGLSAPRLKQRADDPPAR